MPAPPLANSFDAGTNGATISTADTGSGDPVTVVNIGAGAGAVYDNTHTRGAEALKLTNPATAVNTLIGWDGLGTFTGNIYFRAFLYFTAYPVSFDVAFSKCWTAALASGPGLSLGATGSPTPGKLLPFNAAGTFQNAGASSVSVALNKFVRVEWRIYPSATVGELEWKLFNDADAETPDDRAILTGLNTAANIDRVDFGFTASDEPSYSYWLDGIGTGLDWLCASKRSYSDYSKFPKQVPV